MKVLKRKYARMIVVLGFVVLLSIGAAQRSGTTQ